MAGWGGWRPAIRKITSQNPIVSFQQLFLGYRDVQVEQSVQLCVTKCLECIPRFRDVCSRPLKASFRDTCEITRRNTIGYTDRTMIKVLTGWVLLHMRSHRRGPGK